MSKWLSKKGWIRQALSATSSNEFPKYGKAQLVEVMIFSLYYVLLDILK